MAFSIDAGIVISCSNTALPRCAILERERAVAMTVRPCLWMDCASASPMPPALHPVISTVLGVGVDMLVRRGCSRVTKGKCDVM